jgi:hypothetical protein
MKKILLFIFCLYHIAAFSQLAAYTTLQNEVYVWDGGMIRKIDYLKPQALKVGRVAIPYQDNSKNFKIYFNGGVQEINRGFTNNFQATDNLVAYQNASSLYVWENGNNVLLTKNYGDFYVADSVVVFFDKLQKNYKAYYKGNIIELEGFLAGTNRATIFDSELTVTSDDIAKSQFSDIKIADNMVAYINFAGQFKCFYRGMIWDIDDYGVESFGVGRNMLAYVDNNTHLSVFNNGEVKIIENFRPNSYKVGDDFVAYESNENRFKIYYNDSIYDLGSIDHQYKVKDYIVTFKNARGYFSVFYKGKIYELESFIPNKVEISYNSIVYTNMSNMLRMFSKGKIYDVVTADVPWWEMQYDVLTYRFGSNLYKVFYEGQSY